MRTVLLSCGRCVAAFLGAHLAGGALMAQAPVPKPDVVYPVISQASRETGPARTGDVLRTEIRNGSSRRVHYSSPSTSPGERSALADLERAENEAAYAEDLMALRQEYVTSERLLEPYRRTVQQQLYGFNLESTDSSFFRGGYGPGGLGYPFGLGYGGYYGYGYGGSTTVFRSLANGVGDEGRFKDEMVRQIARQATPEYATAAARGVNTALASAAESDRLRAGLRLPGRGTAFAAGEQPRKVTLTMKDGKTLSGILAREDGDWLLVETAGSDVSVRKSDVTRIDRERAK